MQIEDIMKPASGKTPEIILNKEESIDNAATLMKQNKIKEIAIVDDDDKVVGKVTRTDLIQASEEINEDFFID